MSWKIYFRIWRLFMFIAKLNPLISHHSQFYSGHLPNVFHNFVRGICIIDFTSFSNAIYNN